MPNKVLSEAMVKFTLKQIQDLNKRGGITVRRHDSINVAFLEVNATEWFVDGPPHSMRAHLDAAELNRLIRELEYILRHPEVKIRKRDLGTSLNWNIVGPLPRQVKLSYPNTLAHRDGSASVTLKNFVDRYCPPGKISLDLETTKLDEEVTRITTSKMQYLTEAMLKSSLALPDAVQRFVKQAADAEVDAIKRRMFPVMTGRFSSGRPDWWKAPYVNGLDLGQSESRIHRPGLTGHRCTMLFVDDPTKEENVLKKVNNAYYVASPSVTTAREQDQKNDGKNGRLAVHSSDGGKWTRPTLNAAIEHANEMLDKDPSLEHVAITKIVRIVRRRKLPNVVEVVK